MWKIGGEQISEDARLGTWTRWADDSAPALHEVATPTSAPLPRSDMFSATVDAEMNDDARSSDQNLYANEGL